MIIRLTFPMGFLKAIHWSKREIPGKQNNFGSGLTEMELNRHNMDISEESRIFWNKDDFRVISVAKLKLQSPLKL